MTDVMIDEISELAYIRACELVGPNSPEFDALLERIFEDMLEAAVCEPDPVSS